MLRREGKSAQMMIILLEYSLTAYAKLAGVPVNQIEANVIVPSPIEEVGTPKRDLRQKTVNDGRTATSSNQKVA